MTADERSGLIGLGQTVVGSLPAQFLVLVLLNTCFIGGLLWFLDQQAQSRERVLAPIVTSCLQQVPIDVVEKLLKAQQVPSR